MLYFFIGALEACNATPEGVVGTSREDELTSFELFQTDIEKLETVESWLIAIHFIIPKKGIIIMKLYHQQANQEVVNKLCNA